MKSPEYYTGAIDDGYLQELEHLKRAHAAFSGRPGQMSDLLVDYKKAYSRLAAADELIREAKDFAMFTQNIAPIEELYSKASKYLSRLDAYLTGSPVDAPAEARKGEATP